MNNFLDIFINKSTEIAETSYSTYLFIIGLAMFVISFFIDGYSYRYKKYVVLDFFKKKKNLKNRIKDLKNKYDELYNMSLAEENSSLKTISDEIESLTSELKTNYNLKLTLLNIIYFEERALLENVMFHLGFVILCIGFIFMSSNENDDSSYKEINDAIDSLVVKNDSDIHDYLISYDILNYEILNNSSTNSSYYVINYETKNGVIKLDYNDKVINLSNTKLSKSKLYSLDKDKIIDDLKSLDFKVSRDLEEILYEYKLVVIDFK